MDVQDRLSAEELKEMTAVTEMRSTTQTWWLFCLCAVLIAGWLLSSLFLVNIEFDDGYTTILNSQYFLGSSSVYFWQRGPMMAWLLMPAEWVTQFLGLHPMDVRPHHAIMALIHLGYFVGTWWLLVRQFGARGPVLLAFLAAVPNVVFFSYAPFISHDILPGLILLAMLFAAARHAQAPSGRLLVALFLAGWLVSLIKQTYALIWVSILFAHGTLWLLQAAGTDRGRSIARLMIAAACSGLASWCTYAWVLTGSFPDQPWLLRPILQMQLVVAGYQNEGPLREIFYQWVYLRNLGAYGVMAMTLVIPGLYFSWRTQSFFLRSCVLAWIFLFIMLQVIAFKEVRYLYFLAPLTAVLLVTALDALWKTRRSWVLGLSLLLVWDLLMAGQEAFRLSAPFYGKAVTDFLGPLPANSPLRAPLVMTGRLSFVAPERAFFGDRYHRITNLNSEQIQTLYGYSSSMVRGHEDAKLIDQQSLPVGSILIFVNDVAARIPPIAPDNRTSLQDYFVQVVGVAESVQLQREDGGFRMLQPSAQPIMLLHAPGVAAEPLTSFQYFAGGELQALLGVSELPPQLTLMGLRISEMCDLSGCRSF